MQGWYFLYCPGHTCLPIIYVWMSLLFLYIIRNCWCWLRLISAVFNGGSNSFIWVHQFGSFVEWSNFNISIHHLSVRICLEPLDSRFVTLLFKKSEFTVLGKQRSSQENHSQKRKIAGFNGCSWLNSLLGDSIGITGHWRVSLVHLCNPCLRI